jgi:hypothetical protein
MMIMYQETKKMLGNLAAKSSLCCILLVVGVFTAGNLQARTWYVPSELLTIKQAVEDSASYGDTVLVAPGVYDTTSGEDFAINMKNGVVLMSEQGAATTIIDAHLTNKVFHCENCDSTTVIAGFTITRGRAVNGGGIYCSQSSMEIRDNIIRENTATTGSGGGIHCNIADVTIVNNHIAENSAPNRYGGGIYSYNCSSLIERNTVAHNMARWGAGVFNDNSSPTIAHNIIDGNHCTISGAGLDCYMSSSPDIIANVIINNSCGTHGSGIACCYDCAPVIMYNTIARNVGEYGGGIRSLGNSSPQIFYNSIVDNVDGLYLTTDSDVICANDNNIYLNTYQESDYEVVNNLSTPIHTTHNYWLSTDSSSIDALIDGPAYFIPFYDAPCESTPYEPTSVTSVTVMSDSTYTTPLTGNVDIGDTLYLRLEGTDWNNTLIDPALVIITSRMETYGIGVALIETDTSTGVFCGTAYIDTASDDVYNRIGAYEHDTLIIESYVDNTKCDTVMVGPPGVIEERTSSMKIDTYKATIFSGPLLLPEGKKCRVFDITGSVVTPDKIRPGIYFVEIDGQITQKVVKVR